VWADSLLVLSRGDVPGPLGIPAAASAYSCSLPHFLGMASGYCVALVAMDLIGLAQPSDSSPDRLPILIMVIAIIWSSSVHANANWRLSWPEHWITPFTTGTPATSTCDIQQEPRPRVSSNRQNL
jgi:hypothetical protein